MNIKYEKEKYSQGYDFVIGCDEVGKGSLAGPVVAAAVAFASVDLKSKVKSYQVIKSCGIKDSKLLSPKKREELSEVIKQSCVAWGIGEVGPEIIDEINIHNATLLAMRKAVENLYKRISTDAADGFARITDKTRDDRYFLFLDGKFTIPKFDMEQEAVVDGDNKILSVAAASILAKVHRDGLMTRLHKKYPAYDFAKHKGYGTLHHRQMIIQHGLSDIHRRSFCENIIL